MRDDDALGLHGKVLVARGMQDCLMWENARIFPCGSSSQFQLTARRACHWPKLSPLVILVVPLWFRNTLQQQLWQSENMWEKRPAKSTVSEDGGEGGAPGSGAETPVQPCDDIYCSCVGPQWSKMWGREKSTRREGDELIFFSTS